MATDLTKIATCCYCGSRTVLRFDAAMHELTCRSCGAALHHMKPVKVPTAKPTSKPKKASKSDHSDYLSFGRRDRPIKSKKRKPIKRNRRFDLKDLIEDGVEDFLEDLFDVFD